MIVVEGQTVYLYYNPPKELQPVPNVEGQTLEDAQRILGSAGFQISETPVFEVNDQIAENRVIRTDPPANERVEQDTVITLVVSSGPDQQAMPSIVVGQTVDAARAFLEAPPYNFRVNVTERETAEVNAGIVIETNPPANTLVDVGGAGDARRVERGAVGGRAERRRHDRAGGPRRARRVRRQHDAAGPPGGRRQRRPGHGPEREPGSAGADRLGHHDHRRAGSCADDHARPPTTHDDDHHGCAAGHPAATPPP